VNVLTEPGGARAAAIALAERICANAPLAVQASLGLANEVFTAGEDDAWASSDRRHWALVDTDDCKEGIDAFFARRPPEWNNR
jgi:enoyl-CoA hydratase/carnithine racemase